MTKSLQIFALSCREVSLLTLSSLDADSVEKLYQKVKTNKNWRHGEALSYFMLDLIAAAAPYQTIQTIYSELLRQFFWGYAFRGMKEDREESDAAYISFFNELTDSLGKMDFLRFSTILEALTIYDLRQTMGFLSRLGIPGAESILIPDEIDLHTR